MKAVNKQTGIAHDVHSMMGDRIVLLTPEYIKINTNLTTLKERYDLVNDNECNFKFTTPTRKNEESGIQNLTKEIISNVPNVLEYDKDMVKKLKREEESKHKIKLNFYPDLKPEKKQRTKKPKVESNPIPKTKKQVVSNNGSESMTLKGICSELSIDSSKARRVLRKHKVDKPYEWSGNELQRIKKLLV